MLQIGKKMLRKYNRILDWGWTGNCCWFSKIRLDSNYLPFSL